MPKKILIFSVAYVPYVGGAELAIKEITDRLDESEFEFDLITLRFDRSLPKQEKIGRINIHRIGFTKDKPTMADLVKFPLKLNKLFFPITACLKASRLNRKNKYEATWGMMAAYAGFAALFFKITNPKTSFLLTLQEGDPIDYIKKQVRLVYPIFKKIFTKADFIQSISNYLAGFAREMGFKGSLEVVPNAVNVAHFSKKYETAELLELQKKLDKRDGDFFIITTSRLVLKNAIDDIIQSLQYLPDKVSFIILGDGPDLEKLKDLTKKLALENRVKFLGQIDHKEMPKYLKISDVFIRPSLSEGLGNSFLEAMAAGLPVIATPVGGIPDFLFDPVANPDKEPTGLFCRVRDPKSIAEKVTLLLNDRELKNRLIENGEKLVREKYDWNLIAQKMGIIFNKLIK